MFCIIYILFIEWDEWAGRVSVFKCVINKLNTSIVYLNI